MTGEDAGDFLGVVAELRGRFPFSHNVAIPCTSDHAAAGRRPWQALGPGRSARLAELTGPLLGAAFGSGLLPAQSTLGIATIPFPAPRP